MDPEQKARLERIFDKAPFLKNLGIKLSGCGPGWCEARLEVQNYHKQQDRLVHAGVIATLADHCAGGAAATLLPPDKTVLTVEFKINLLRPGRGEALRARAQVIKPGRLFTIAESEVFALAGSEEKLIAKALVTLALVANARKTESLEA